MKKTAKMSKKNDYWVSPSDDGWKAQRENNERASGVFGTQKEAEDYARQVLKNTGGGELITQDIHGRIRSKDTIGKPDPFPPRDTEF